MPGGDGTGPIGMGQMTGRGAGYCAGYPAPGYANFALSRGFGLGRGFGRGRGMGGNRLGGGSFQRYQHPAARYYQDPNVSGPTPQQEAEMLKKDAKFMQEEVNAINQRVNELEALNKKTE